MEGDGLSYSDCVLASKLHHVRIAGEFFRGLGIPEDMHKLWAYMKSVYATRVFHVSCPLDRDILLHYLEKVDFESMDARNQAHHEIILLPQDRQSTFIPSEDPRAASEMPRLSSTGVTLRVHSVMPCIEYDKTVKARLSRLYSPNE